MYTCKQCEGSIFYSSSEGRIYHIENLPRELIASGESLSMIIASLYLYVFNFSLIEKLDIDKK